MNFKDITGNVYGKLTVLGFYGNSKWKCKCECGNITYVTATKLKSGHTKSCGCIPNRQHSDLTGKVFGKLTAIRFSHKSKGVNFWECKCECGNTTIVSVSSLNSGHTKSCGCIKHRNNYNDITGKRFGSLVVIKFNNVDNGNVMWDCLCDCGAICTYSYESLVRGGVNSCGCRWRKEDSDLTGKTFNNLFVTGFSHIDYNTKHYFWKCSCIKCGKTTIVERSHLISGHTKSCGCINTAHSGSKDELIIKEYLETLMNFSIDKTKDKLDGKEIDMYIDELNLGIEYNGSVFHASLNGAYDDKPKYYHRDKFLCAKENGIHLINIFDVDWNNNQDKIKMYLKSLVVSNKKLYARKCEFKVITKQVADDFTDMYHIQGKARQNTINYGLYYNNELYAVMSFGKLRLSKTDDGQYELHRYCVKDGYTIVGGANKLLKAFEREHNPTYIRSYSDNDYFMGGIYERLGFNNSGQCTPRYYWYYHNNEIKREKCMLKHLKVEYPELLQEAYDTNAKNKEDYVMIKLGASKVYRSGNTKWEKTY